MTREERRKTKPCKQPRIDVVNTPFGTKVSSVDSSVGSNAKGSRVLPFEPSRRGGHDGILFMSVGPTVGAVRLIFLHPSRVPAGALYLGGNPLPGPPGETLYLASPGENSTWYPGGKIPGGTDPVISNNPYPGGKPGYKQQPLPRGKTRL